jgi:hypothetical protein
MVFTNCSSITYASIQKYSEIENNLKVELAMTAQSCSILSQHSKSNRKLAYSDIGIHQHSTD